MRIISEFRDYYDVGQQYGQDQNVIYRRETIMVKDVTDKKEPCSPHLKEIHTTITNALPETNMWYYSRGWIGRDIIANKERDYYIKTGLIFFAGELRTFITLRTIGTGQNETFYDAASIIKFCDDNKINIDTRKRYDRKVTRNNFEEYFNLRITYDKDWFIEKKVIIALVRNRKLIINPCLKDYDFYKVKDAYTAYMELDMWVSGTLSFPQNALVEIEDKYKVIEHGFDEKYGFRTRPKV